jgi:7,8-dihydropterin-6-yl-methyl-4-(beta-D-ribofuranosyl)aminobenzene 5'-phosphate synthase
MKSICLLIILFVLIISSCERQAAQKEVFETQNSIIVIYDNNEFYPELETGWGFSCVIKLKNKNILFDTGADSPTLLSNMEKLGIRPEEIDIIVLSHMHSDHTGGLDGFLNENSNVTVYLPASFPNSIKNRIIAAGAKYVEIGNSSKIMENVYSTGELGTGIIEQSLIIETEKGLVVITGCAHPGIVNIVRASKELLNKDIYLVLGGFHLGSTTDAEIGNIINSFRSLGIEKAGPCHCSGDRARDLFKQEYKEDYIEIGVGKIIEIK